ncbi:MAG: amidohydrolase family protein [Synergistaceae bacterium]|nr:amidohydrolase family protein [Synergistaceae bacterium]
MSGSLIVKNGTVLDSSLGINREASVMIDDAYFAGIYDKGNEPPAVQEIDASGCLVMPGLIDTHIHVFNAGTENGIIPDLTLLPMGVTAGIDQGSAGSGNFQGFYDSIISKSKVHIFAALNISTSGLITSSYPENLDPKFFKAGDIQRLFKKYPDVLCGIKVRISKELVGDLGLLPLEKALEVAEKVGTRISVHTTNPPAPVSEFIQLFRKDDIYSHAFQGRGYSILNDKGKLSAEVHEARSRGVIFDTADARVHYLYPVIKAALAENFLPDTISTDLVQGSVFQPGVFGLPRIMSKYLELGVPLIDVVRAVTERPAEIVNRKGQLGTLREGACADLAIFKLVDCESNITDREGNTLTLHKILVPQCTILGGKVVFRQFNF